MYTKMSKKLPAYLMVKDQDELHRIAAGLIREKAIAVDLESDSMFHYQEKVCLLQISTPTQNIVLDTLSLNDLSLLSPIFDDPNMRKVFHGADYDIRSLYRDFGIEVNALFDTQIAARFLGIRETGLASLLRGQLGLVVEKKYQKKDWSVRPLPDDMIAYAIQDACHLLPLSRILENDLRAKDRLFCVEEECELLSKVRPVAPNNKPLFHRFKGAKRLDSRSLALLEAILQLREELARSRNLPPYKILGNEPIIKIVGLRPATKRELQLIKGVSSKQMKMLGSSILKTIAEVLELSENELPEFPTNTEPRSRTKMSKRVKALRGWRDRRASEMGIEPSLVCTNAQIRSLALGYREKRKVEDMAFVDILHMWQRRLFGGEINTLLDGLG